MDKKKHIPPHKLVRIFSLMMLIYLLLVNVWGLGTPLGEISKSHKPMESQALLSSNAFHLPEAFLGDWILGYQILNMALLYGCMYALFFLTWQVLRGPIWFGSLAATLIMAHPMKSLAMLSPDGMYILLPALLSLSCMAYYMAHVRWGGHWHYRFALLSFLLLTPFQIVQLGVLVALALLEWGTKPALARYWPRVLPFLGIMLLAACYVGIEQVQLHFMNGFLSLFYCVYPLEMLEETHQMLMDKPARLAGAITLGIVMAVGLGLSIRHSAYWIAISAALVFALLGGAAPGFYVKNSTGMVMLSFAAIAFCAVMQRIFDLPQWRRPIIILTAMLCIFFFALQIREYAKLRSDWGSTTVESSWSDNLKEWESGGSKGVECSS